MLSCRCRAYTEREGTFTSGERRVQRYLSRYPRSNLAAWPILLSPARLGSCLDLDLESRLASLVMRRIAAEIPGYRWHQLTPALAQTSGAMADHRARRSVLWRHNL